MAALSKKQSKLQQEEEGLKLISMNINSPVQLERANTMLQNLITADASHPAKKNSTQKSKNNESPAKHRKSESSPMIGFKRKET